MASSTPNSLAMAGQPVDPDRLQNMGKTAARLAETSGLSLSEAVVRTVEREKLNSEQVRRVVESANIEAFNRKFASMTGGDRFVSIDDGPADPQQVLSQLGCAQSGEYEIGTTDYDLPPTKVAELTSGTMPVHRTRGGAVGDVLRLQSKLAAAHEIVVQDAEAASAEMGVALADLGDWVKRATLNGAEAGEVYASWAGAHPEIAKLAANRLMGGVPALTKVAGRRLNPEHPVVASFAHFVKTAQDFHKLLGVRQNLESQLLRVGKWLQENGN